MTDEKSLTPEMLEKAKSAPNAAALLAVAQENGITLTAEEAATYYAKLHAEPGAISDEELDKASGGRLYHTDEGSSPNAFRRADS